MGQAVNRRTNPKLNGFVSVNGRKTPPLLLPNILFAVSPTPTSTSPSLRKKGKGKAVSVTGTWRWLNVCFQFLLIDISSFFLSKT